MVRGAPAILVVLVVVVSGTGAAATVAGPGAESDWVPVIVVFSDPASLDESVITRRGGKITGGTSIGLLPVRFARVEPSEVPRIERHPNVSSVTRDATVATAEQVAPWGVSRINATGAATRVNDSAEGKVTVAIIDTGVDVDHPELADDLVWGVDTNGKGPVRYGIGVADDDNGHGTHVAGIVGATDDGRGVVGTAPNARLYAIKVADRSGKATHSDLIEGIEAALAGPDNQTGTADDADILSISLGGRDENPALADLIDRVGDRAVIVAAAGNNGDGDRTTDNVTYPARYPKVTAVGATTARNRVPPWSGDGPSLELAAPGIGIKSTYPGGYTRRSGTSMAAPHVSGAAALLIAADLADGRRDLSPGNVRRRLRKTAKDIGPKGRDNFSGRGLVQINAAVGTVPVPLSLSANRTTVMAGDPVQFSVTRRDTGSGVPATLDIGGENHSTGKNGSVVVTIDRVGNVTATARKAPTPSTTFSPDSLVVSVRPAPAGRQFDIDRNGRVDTDEVIWAIRIWSIGRLETTDVVAVIDAWAERRRV